jgi:hypothetical protein
MSQQTPAQGNFKPAIVYMILNKQTEQALELLAKEYRVETPNLEVGLPKGHSRNAYGTYNAKNHTISVLDSDIFSNPFVILHEFYHHLRCKNVDKQHKGTEKNADKFALDYIAAYESAVKAAEKKANFCHPHY